MRNTADRLVELPTGTVTFVFTDIEGSTLLLQHWGEEAYGQALDEHYGILRQALAEHGGLEVDTQGDALFAVFSDARQAAAMALTAQARLGEHPWPGGGRLRVRIGLHTGEARRGGEDYVGLAVHQAARVASAAHGGQVVASSATVAAAGALEGGAYWRPQGPHRLKDLGVPVELSQLCHPLLSSEFPPLRSLERVAHNLPVQLSSFWGRGEELALGSKLLAAARLLTITGAGGTGKTRLAYQLAAQAIGEFPDGAWVAELAAVSGPGIVPTAVMAALGLRDEPSRSATETVVAHLAGRRALLVLDNCEHVVDAAAALVTAVLKGCPEVRALATGREPLRVEGETVWPLGPLALPASGEERAAVLATSDAVGLFCERAAETRVGFHLDDANAATVAEICARLEGIPLALELAAARLRSLPLAELARRLAQDIALLSKAPRGAHSRQASLEATLNWSHQLLSAPEQVLFRRLALFAGGFSLASAEAVCGGAGLDGELVDALDGLVDKSLVSLSAERAGEGRYRLLEPVRAYAARRLGAAGERDLIAERHAACFVRLAQEVRERAASGASSAAWEAEHPNFLAALEYLSATGMALAHGRLAVDLWDFWHRLGHLRIGVREYRRYMARPDGDPSCRVACARYLGNLSSFLGDLAEARRWHAEALRLAREQGDRRAEATCLRNCGNDSFLEGDFSQARAYYGDALVIAGELGDRTMEGRCAGGLGNVAAGQGDWRAAWRSFSEALAIAQEVGDRLFEASWHENRGSMAVSLGKYAEARQDLLQALRLSAELGARRSQTGTRTFLGDLSTSLGDHSGARAYYEEALELARPSGDRRNESWAEGGLGVLALKLGSYAEAARHLGAAYDLAVEAGDKAAEGQWLAWLGALDLGQGHLAAAAARCVQAMAISRQVGNRDTESFVLGLQGDVAARAGELAEARDRFGEAVSTTGETGRRGLQSQLLGKLSDVAARLADHAEARSLIAQALAIAGEIGEKDGFLLEVAAGVLALTGQYCGAAEILGAADQVNESVGKKRSAWDQARYDATLAQCADSLGPERLAACLDAGSRLGWAGAVERALSALGEH